MNTKLFKFYRRLGLAGTLLVILMSASYWKYQGNVISGLDFEFNRLLTHVKELCEDDNLIPFENCKSEVAYYPALKKFTTNIENTKEVKRNVLLFWLPFILSIFLFTWVLVGWTIWGNRFFSVKFDKSPTL